LAIVAIRSSFVETVGELGVSSIVPSLGSDFPAPPFAQQGPVGSVPPRHRSYCGAPTSRQPVRARFPSHGRSRVGRSWRDLPGSWAALAYVPQSLTPVEPARRGPGLAPCAGRADFAFRHHNGVGLHHIDLSGLDPAARTPAVYASWSRSPVYCLRPRKTRCRLATSSLGGGDFHPGLLFEVLGATSLLSDQASPGALW